jgi:hypothetical protein
MANPNLKISPVKTTSQNADIDCRHLRSRNACLIVSDVPMKIHQLHHLGQLKERIKSEQKVPRLLYRLWTGVTTK